MAEWIIYMLECEIKEAYIKKNYNLYTFYSYCQKTLDTDAKI